MQKQKTRIWQLLQNKMRQFLAPTMPDSQGNLTLTGKDFRYLHQVTPQNWRRHPRAIALRSFANNGCFCGFWQKFDSFSLSGSYNSGNRCYCYSGGRNPFPRTHSAVAVSVYAQGPKARRDSATSHRAGSGQGNSCNGCPLPKRCSFPKKRPLGTDYS